jgi:hypothetical protein
LLSLVARAHFSAFKASAISFDRFFRWWTMISIDLLLIIASRCF